MYFPFSQFLRFGLELKSFSVFGKLILLKQYRREQNIFSFQSESYFLSLHKNGLKRPARLMSSSKTPLSLSLCLKCFSFLFFYIRNSFRLSTRRRRWRIAVPPSVSAARTGSSLLSRKLSAASSTRRGQTGTCRNKQSSGYPTDPGSGTFLTVGSGIRDV